MSTLTLKPNAGDKKVCKKKNLSRLLGAGSKNPSTELFLIEKCSYCLASAFAGAKLASGVPLVIGRFGP